MDKVELTVLIQIAIGIAVFCVLLFGLEFLLKDIKSVGLLARTVIFLVMIALSFWLPKKLYKYK